MLSPYTHAITSYIPTSIVDSFKYHPAASSADDIQAQIMKSEDPAQKFIHLVEDGSVKRAWEEQKKLPSATWLGNFVDRIFGWGKFYKESAQKSSQSLKRDIQGNYIDSLKNCEYVSKPPFFYSNSAEDYQYEVYIFDQPITTGLKNVKEINGSCAYNQPEEYYARLSFSYAKKNKNPYIFETVEECRAVTTCMYNASLECSPHCFPCISAEGKQLTEQTDDFQGLLKLEFNSPTIQNLVYQLTVSNTPWPVNYWKANQTLQVFSRIVKECEETEMAKYNEMRKNKREEFEFRVNLETGAVLVLGITVMLGYAGKRYFDYTNACHNTNTLSWLGSRCNCGIGNPDNRLYVLFQNVFDE